MKKYYVVLFFLLVAGLLSGFAQTVTSQKGLTTAIFNLPAGIIKIYLPDDIRPGDVISGSISAEPAGKNVKQQGKNLAELKMYTVDFNGQKFPVSATGKSLQCNIDKNIQSLRPLSLVNSSGTNIGQVNILSPQITEPKSLSADCKIPTHALTSAPLQITGPFDGNSSNTKCNVGGKEAEVLAESPRKCIIQFPPDANGVKTLTVQENKQPVCSKQVSGVEMNVSAGKLNLLKGEKTYIKVEITGLQNLPDTALLTLANITSDVVIMKPSNDFLVLLVPDSLGKGFYTRSFDIQSLKTGTFTVNVNLDLPDAPKDIYTDIPKTNYEIKTDTVPCKDLEEKLKALEEALQKLTDELTIIGSEISKLKYALTDCKEALEKALNDYYEKQKAFKILETLKIQRDLNPHLYSKTQIEQNDKEYTKAKDARDASLKKWRDQKHECDAIEAKIAEMKAREKALPGLIKTAEDELKKSKDDLEKCKTKALEDKKKKEEEERKKTETQPQPAVGSINPGTGAEKEGSPCNPEGVELVEPVKRVYGSCYVKETEITPCNTDRISNELLEAIKKAFEKFKKLSGPLEIAEKVASCASTSKAICVNVYLVRNWEDVQLTYVCVKGKWVLKNRKVTGRGEEGKGWHIVKDKEVGNLCCWVFGKKEDAENAMEAHLKEAIQDVLDQCK